MYGAPKVSGMEGPLYVWCSQGVRNGGATVCMVLPRCPEWRVHCMYGAAIDTKYRAAATG